MADKNMLALRLHGLAAIVTDTAALHDRCADACDGLDGTAQQYVAAAARTLAQAGEYLAEAGLAITRELDAPPPPPHVCVPLSCGHDAQVPEDEVPTRLFWCAACRQIREKEAVSAK